MPMDAGLGVDERARQRKHFGRIISEARHNLKMSQAEVARKLNDTLEEGWSTTQAVVSQWERGETMPFREKWAPLESVLGLVPGTLAAAVEMAHQGLGLLPPIFMAKLAQLDPKDRDGYLSLMEAMLDRAIQQTRQQSKGQ